MGRGTPTDLSRTQMTRKILLALIVAVGLTAIGVLLVGRERYSHLELKSCFNDVQGLKAGASVRIAGVDVGTVRRVRANPEMRNCPAEVEMELATTYEIRVPNVAIPAIASFGTLISYVVRSEEHTSELQSLAYLVCRLLLEKKNRSARNCSSAS